MDDATLLVWIDRGRTLSFALVAVGVVGEFLVDRVSGPIIKRRDAAQQAEIARFNKEAGDARTSAANAEARAAQVGEGTAKALAQAAAANERATSLEVEAAQQRERAAKAEHDLLELQQRMADRHLTPGQQKTIADKLRAFAGHSVNLFAYASDGEIIGISNDVGIALISAGWSLHAFMGQEIGRAVRGILVEVKANADARSIEAANALVSTLASERLAVSGPFPQQTNVNMMGSGDSDPKAQIIITIGKKP
jgi:hypothetical protein